MAAYQTAEQMIASQQRTAEADALADSDPSAVTAADLAAMSDAKRSAFLASGAAAHLGIGAPRHPRRRR